MGSHKINLVAQSVETSRLLVILRLYVPMVYQEIASLFISKSYPVFLILFSLFHNDENSVICSILKVLFFLIEFLPISCHLFSLDSSVLVYSIKIH